MVGSVVAQWLLEALQMVLILGGGSGETAIETPQTMLNGAISKQLQRMIFKALNDQGKRRLTCAPSQRPKGTILTALLGVSQDESKQDAVDELDVFEHASLQNAFSDKASFFQYAHGGRIPPKHRCLEPREL